MVKLLGVVSALSFLTSNIIRIVHLYNFHNSPGGPGRTHNLDSVTLESAWDFRRRESPLYQSGNAINALAWFCFAIPVLQMAWGLSRGGVRKTGIHTAIAIFVLGGCATEFVARLMLVGMTSTSLWVSSEFNLDNWLPSSYAVNDDGIGWKVLEITHMILRGLIVWVDAFEWICLFFICMLTYFSIGTQMEDKRVLSMHFARLGLAIGFFAFVDFSADILRFMDFRSFMPVAIVIGIFNSIFLLPVWVVYLAFHVDKLVPEYSPAQDSFFGSATTNI
mmetsp:Transcript_41627/g.58584  ORF Transcript_41627/g.58584 Transcript_41627/m.58584 type:complete len:277 (-) Transcript_41627:66-896(-)